MLSEKYSMFSPEKMFYTVSINKVRTAQEERRYSL